MDNVEEMEKILQQMKNIQLNRLYIPTAVVRFDQDFI